MEWLCISKEVMLSIVLTPPSVSPSAHGDLACGWLVWQGKTDTPGRKTGGKTGVWMSLRSHQLWPDGEIQPWEGRLTSCRGERVSRQWEEEPSSSYTDPEGSVHMRSLSRVYPERMLNHPVLYCTGCCVPPICSVSILRLYLIKMFFSQSSTCFLQRRAIWH